MRVALPGLLRYTKQMPFESPLRIRFRQSGTALCVLAGLAGLPSCGRTASVPHASSTSSSSRASSTSNAALTAGTTPAALSWDGLYAGSAFELTPQRALGLAAAALKKTGFTVEANAARREGEFQRILAANPEGVPAEVKVRALPIGKTEIRVKIGTVGDRGGAERILDEIRKGAAAK